MAIQKHFRKHGFGLWAIEVAGVAPFVDFAGFAVPEFTAHFTPCVEVGWRLAFDIRGVKMDKLLYTYNKNSRQLAEDVYAKWTLLFTSGEQQERARKMLATNGVYSLLSDDFQLLEGVAAFSLVVGLNFTDIPRRSARFADRCDGQPKRCRGEPLR
jgi:hypothetical protein